MAAEVRGVRRTAPRRKTTVTADEAGVSAPAAASVATPATRARRNKAASGDQPAVAAPTRRRTRSTQHPAAEPQYDRPAVAACPGLDDLRALAPAAARQHVHDYLHAVMSPDDADTFEVLAYRWELQLVKIDRVRLVRGVTLDPKKVRRYRAVLRRGGGFPPLVGLGGEGEWATESVMLCDGYHRIAATRNTGIYFVWVWLAVGLWDESQALIPATSSPAGA
jgi:hypothetical protein